MQNIISANQKSVTESEATKDAMIPFYSASKALPELGIQFQKLTPYINFGNATAPADKTLVWKLPPGSGFLYEGSIGLTCTSTALVSNDLLNDFGLNMVGQIDWMCNGQPVLTMTGAALRALVKTLPIAQQLYIFRYSKPLNPTTEKVAAPADTTFLTYIPLIASWLSETQKALLLNQIGDLQLRLTFAPLLQFGITLGSTVSAVTSSELFLQTYMPKLSVYNQMVLNDWSKTLVMECFNTYTEVVPLSSTTTVSNYTITCPFLAYRMHFFVQNVIGTVGSPMTEINDITMNIGGTPFISSFKKSRLQSLKAKSGIASCETTNNTAVSFDNELVTTLDFGVNSTRDKNTGTAFLQELRGATVSVSFPAVGTTADAVLYIVTEYWQNVAFNPGANSSSGSLNIYTNN